MERETAFLLIILFVAMLFAATDDPSPDISDDVGICNRPSGQMAC